MSMILDMIAYLLIEAFKSPNTFTQIINFIPPSQTHQDSPTHILDHPKVKSRKKYSNHKNDDKIVNK